MSFVWCDKPSLENKKYPDHCGVDAARGYLPEFNFFIIIIVVLLYF